MRKIELEIDRMRIRNLSGIERRHFSAALERELEQSLRRSGNQPTEAAVAAQVKECAARVAMPGVKA
jgi:hypothetical protein